MSKSTAHSIDKNCNCYTWELSGSFEMSECDHDPDQANTHTRMRRSKHARNDTCKNTHSYDPKPKGTYASTCARKDTCARMPPPTQHMCARAQPPTRRMQHVRMRKHMRICICAYTHAHKQGSGRMGVAPKQPNMHLRSRTLTQGRACRRAKTNIKRTRPQTNTTHARVRAFVPPLAHSITHMQKHARTHTQGRSSMCMLPK